MKNTGKDPDALDSFDPAVRGAALAAAAAAGGFPEPGGNVNMHLHSFHSFNALGWSPARIALAARRAGLHAAALCDFDVLDGMEEFLAAGALLGLRAAVHIETRAYLREFADVDINSPGEHGVTYIMGAGFVLPPRPGSAEAATLGAFRAQARRRNEELVARINAALPELAVDYARDVLPLTPGGNATERHIIRGYVGRAQAVYPQAGDRATAWGRVLGIDASKSAALMADPPALEEQVRSRLAKRGGLGYEQPTERTFPPADDFAAWVARCRAIPMAAYLDGTSGGEADAHKLLECLAAKGIAAVNIIPDRNWNLKKPEEAALKQARLAEFVAASEDMGLPINIGTEMNRLGLPFVDDLAGPALSRYAQPFRRGAQIMVGHTILARYGDLSYVDEAAGPRAEKNRLFQRVGALPPLEERRAAALASLGPARALERIRDSAASGRWV
jgi:hypothetical protein